MQKLTCGEDFKGKRVRTNPHEICILSATCGHKLMGNLSSHLKSAAELSQIFFLWLIRGKIYTISTDFAAEFKYVRLLKEILWGLHLQVMNKMTIIH